MPDCIKMDNAIGHQSILNKLDGCLESQKIDAKEISTVRYGLLIYPNGRSETDRGNVWIGLNVNIGSEKRIEADFMITVDSSGFKKSFTHVFESSNAWSSKGDKMCTYLEIFDPNQKFICFDELVIRVEGLFTVKRQIKVKSLAIRNLSSYLWEREDKDFIIVADEIEFNVHKFVLSARSKFFEKMFSNNKWQETTNGKMTVQGFSSNVVEIAIKFFYDRNIATSDLLTLPNAMSSLEFSNMYLVDDLKDDIEAFLIGNINVANVCELTNFSLKANAPKLEKICFEFLTKCLKNATPINKFDELDHEFLVKLLKNAFYAVSETS